MLIGELKNDSGVIESGENIKIGYISQERWFNRPNKKVIDEFLKNNKDI